MYEVHDSQHSPEHDEHVPTASGGAPHEDVERTETVPTKHGSARDDVESDPAHDDRLGSDWIDEGGATSVGPATSTPGGVETEASKRQVRIDRERDEQRERSGGDEHEEGAH